MAVGLRRPSSFLSYLAAALEWLRTGRHEASAADIHRTLARSVKSHRQSMPPAAAVSLWDAEVVRRPAWMVIVGAEHRCVVIGGLLGPVRRDTHHNPATRSPATIPTESCNRVLHRWRYIAYEIVWGAVCCVRTITVNSA